MNNNDAFNRLNTTWKETADGYAERENRSIRNLSVVEGFLFLVLRSRSAVALDFRNYWNGNRDDSLHYYREDRNKIRRATTALKKMETKFRMLMASDRQESPELERAAQALIDASKLTRFDWTEGKGWHYTPGQYQPTEIRSAAVLLLERAERLLRDSLYTM